MSQEEYLNIDQLENLTYPLKAYEQTFTRYLAMPEIKPLAATSPFEVVGYNADYTSVFLCSKMPAVVCGEQIGHVGCEIHLEGHYVLRALDPKFDEKGKVVINKDKKPESNVEFEMPWHFAPCTSMIHAGDFNRFSHALWKHIGEIQQNIKVTRKNKLIALTQELPPLQDIVKFIAWNFLKSTIESKKGLPAPCDIPATAGVRVVPV